MADHDVKHLCLRNHLQIHCSITITGPTLLMLHHLVVNTPFRSAVACLAPEALFTMPSGEGGGGHDHDVHSGMMSAGCPTMPHMPQFPFIFHTTAPCASVQLSLCIQHMAHALPLWAAAAGLQLQVKLC